MGARRRDEHSSSTSSLLIIKFIFILFLSHVQLVRTCSHVIRFIPKVAVYSIYIYNFFWGAIGARFNLGPWLVPWLASFCALLLPAIMLLIQLTT